MAVPARANNARVAQLKLARRPPSSSAMAAVDAADAWQSVPRVRAPRALFEAPPAAAFADDPTYDAFATPVARRRRAQPPGNSQARGAAAAPRRARATAAPSRDAGVREATALGPTRTDRDALRGTLARGAQTRLHFMPSVRDFEPHEAHPACEVRRRGAAQRGRLCCGRAAL